MLQGIETGNKFVRNLAMYTRNQDIIIPPSNVAMNGAETDGQVAAFWITNANNDFIDNIAAGAQTSGFWFELMKRGTRASEYPDLEPKEVPLGVIDGNVVHSVPSIGFRFYLNGYTPPSLQTITNLKIYR